LKKDKIITLFWGLGEEMYSSTNRNVWEKNMSSQNFDLLIAPEFPQPFAQLIKRRDATTHTLEIKFLVVLLDFLPRPKYFKPLKKYITNFNYTRCIEIL